MLIGSGNKLKNLHHLYCGGDELDKSLVKIFVDGTLDDVRENFQVLQKIKPWLFFSLFSLSGALIWGRAFIWGEWGGGGICKWKFVFTEKWFLVSFIWIR